MNKSILLKNLISKYPVLEAIKIYGQMILKFASKTEVLHRNNIPKLFENMLPQCGCCNYPYHQLNTGIVTDLFPKADFLAQIKIK
jgi:hypothetical protein